MSSSSAAQLFSLFFSSEKKTGNDKLMNDSTQLQTYILIHIRNNELLDYLRDPAYRIMMIHATKNKERQEMMKMMIFCHFIPL